ncbi:ABC transporter permease subunit [Spirochaeta isovalerica]|uniref:Branched-chain amino acid transport system permease protein n=1 Tax=Spirochaeta isovalerica TaxID=150 RepID=A0A841REE4_9SPIO|nr:branched-chain amino acid ABC transporter permease [Spirochaeta isovalerica]MBB6481370.1 branched-chain amino acid transport system permease protein [Spirochaeta isovalerica]
MFKLNEIKKSFLTSIWFMFLTFPIMVIKVNTITDTVEWRWKNLAYVGIGAFILSFVWRWALDRRAKGGKAKKDKTGFNDTILSRTSQLKLPAIIGLGLLVVFLPFFSGMYTTSIVTTALMYVILGLGLNVVVGLGGLLHLGYAAFYAVGAYTYALLHYHFGISFWVALPLGALFSAVLGLLIGFPVLRLRGDYLAIVTLAFGEITRLVLENWNDFSFGPSGIANIARPGIAGVKMKLPQATIFIYFIAIAMVILTIFIVNRLENSRVGRAWEAMREDEIASQSMGIDITKTKLLAFSIGAVWAGFVGVLFAAKTTFINPASFTVWESITVLCVVVIGGMGSIPGVIVGALVFTLLPELLRSVSEYRMLVFGIALVIMMIFRPGGLIQKTRKSYKFKEEGDGK